MFVCLVFNGVSAQIGYLTFFNLPRPATAATTMYYCVTPQISETAHRTLGLACGFGTVGLQ